MHEVKNSMHDRLYELPSQCHYDAAGSRIKMAITEASTSVTVVLLLVANIIE